MASAVRDERDQAHVRHTLKELLAQRSVQICQGYADANDCDTMRDDPAPKDKVPIRAPALRLVMEGLQNLLVPELTPYLVLLAGGAGSP